ncbi:hypothetical protein BKA65DRAFT_549311 [Rhexocercosporidium sp. MPI-PUGE-AT-0058]|nr:hypothetical protein BKA65DRAFT_549311 [Rhexocercosporidium sp. MPI-PUGE-AT-0058]
MDPNSYVPIETNNLNPLFDYHAIRTQIDADEEWDQFWQEFNSLNPEPINTFNTRWVDPPKEDLTMHQAMETQQHIIGADMLPPSPTRQLQLPLYGSNMILPSYIDTSLTPSWADPSTSNSSPSATSSRMSFSTTSSTSTPPNASSSTSEGSFVCRFCAQTFAQKCLLNRHINTHTKPYACPFDSCSTRRATNRDLKRHMIVHDPVSAPAFLCTERGCEFSVKGFNRRDNLKRHMENVH